MQHHSSSLRFRGTTPDHFKKEHAMPTTPAFYWIKESTKPIPDRVHHNNTWCTKAKDIPRSDRRPGTGTYRLCRECEDLNRARR